MAMLAGQNMIIIIMEVYKMHCIVQVRGIICMMLRCLVVLGAQNDCCAPTCEIGELLSHSPPGEPGKNYNIFPQMCALPHRIGDCCEMYHPQTY